MSSRDILVNLTLHSSQDRKWMSSNELELSLAFLSHLLCLNGGNRSRLQLQVTVLHSVAFFVSSASSNICLLSNYSAMLHAPFYILHDSNWCSQSMISFPPYA